MPTLIDEKDMPAPRLEFRWVKTGQSWSIRECAYNLVIPLRELDMRRENSNGDQVRDVLTVEIGRTEVKGSNHNPPMRDNIKEVWIDTPFRDGAHAKWDALALGGTPIYAVCEGKAMLIENDAKPD